jgi:hypothetical protein
VRYPYASAKGPVIAKGSLAWGCLSFKHDQETALSDRKEL